MTPTGELRYYGHGKLLLTSEYFILDGALGLAIPTRFGQQMRVRSLSSTTDTIYWVALNHLRQPWLNLVFDKKTLLPIASNTKEAHTLSQILTSASELNPLFLSGDQDLAVETYLEFPNQWGLGSSSTLIHLIAQWAAVDGITLLRKTIGGSGYDVACAAYDTPITYQLTDATPQITSVGFAPTFADQLFFVYTGQKQVSSSGISHYRAMVQHPHAIAQTLTDLTDDLLQCDTLHQFEQIITSHEQLISDALALPTVRSRLFSDYWGAVKSLGAWGGDYVLITSDRPESELLSYLHTKQMPVVFRYQDMIWR